MSEICYDGERPLSRDCMYACAPAAPALCTTDWCQCSCHEQQDRARAADDRDPAVLKSVARDMETERQPDTSSDRTQLLATLTRERFRPQERQRCRSCGAAIVWATTGGRRAMPVDPDPVAGGNLQLVRDSEALAVTVVRAGEGTHQSHYVTCPHAENWRRRRSAA